MFTYKKIGIIVIIFAVFVMGGVAFNAYQAGAFGTDDGGYKHGFFRGGFGGLHAIDKDSPEWQEKKEAWGEKMEEFKAARSEDGEFKKHGFGFKHPFGFNKFSDEINHEVINIENGVQITITSDNPDLVQKLQDAAAKYSGD